MAFSQATITEGPVLRVDNAELSASWSSSSPAGTVFQLYRDRVLVYGGPRREVVLPLPSGPAYYQVGTVGPAEAAVDYSGSLPAIPGDPRKITRDWYGGRYLGAVVEYRVYLSPSPGLPADMGRPVAVVNAEKAGIRMDGYGAGGYGAGGYGSGAVHYSWTSGPLRSGAWEVKITAVDSAGNESSPLTSSHTLAVPPPPPAADSLGRRLTYTYNPGTGRPTLNWLASL